MKLGKNLDMILLILSVVFVFIAIYSALIVADMIPTDVSSVVRKPARYDGQEIRIKGIVLEWEGDESFVLRDVTTPFFKLNVSHSGGFPSDFGNGKTIYAKGEFSENKGPLLSSLEIEVVEESKEWTAVSTVVWSPSEYHGTEIRVKGTVMEWDGNSTFIFRDVTTEDFTLNITHNGNLPSGFAVNKTYFVIGTFSDLDPPHISSTEVVIAKDVNIPAGWIAPYAQKIFYFHVPAAWVSFVAFGVVLIGSILFLRKPYRKWDTIAYSSAEVGIVFCTLAIVTGPIWGKAEWGVYWRWEDTKLTITFILWLIFIAYLILRGGAESEDKSRLAAVFGIIGFVCVPLSFISSRIWQSMHPNIVASGEGSMGSGAGMSLGMAVIAFTFVYLFMLRKRIKIQEMTYKINEIKDEIGGI
jgi:heme exporter protein C